MFGFHLWKFHIFIKSVKYEIKIIYKININYAIGYFIKGHMILIVYVADYHGEDSVEIKRERQH